jgi:hypothetical protein
MPAGLLRKPALTTGFGPASSLTKSAPGRGEEGQVQALRSLPKPRAFAQGAGLKRQLHRLNLGKRTQRMGRATGPGDSKSFGTEGACKVPWNPVGTASGFPQLDLATAGSGWRLFGVTLEVESLVRKCPRVSKLHTGSTYLNEYCCSYERTREGLMRGFRATRKE